MDCKEFQCVIMKTCMYHQSIYCRSNFKVCSLSCPCEVCSKRNMCNKNLFSVLKEVRK